MKNSAILILRFAIILPVSFVKLIACNHLDWISYAQFGGINIDSSTGLN